MPSEVRLAHVWSSDMGASLSLPYLRPLLERRWRITVICPDGPRLGELRDLGVAWRPLSLSRRAFDPKGDVESLAQIIRYCREDSYDTVHTHNIKAGHVGRIAARLARTSRIVHTMHGMAFDTDSPPLKRLGHAALEWAACRAVDRVLVQSREDRDTLLRLRLLAPEKLVRIGNGVDLTRFGSEQGIARQRERHALGVRDDEVLVVSAGRLVHEKGFVELIDGFLRAQRDDARLRLAIAGPRDVDKSDCLSDAEMNRARAGGVMFLGERADMVPVYAAADIVALASWREGMPRVLMEAAAMSKPLLATDVRGCREVAGGAGGYLVPVRSPDALAKGMLELAADPARRSAMGASNRLRAFRDFDLRACVREVVNVYDQLLGTMT